MKRFLKVMGVLSIVMLLVAGVTFGQIKQVKPGKPPVTIEVKPIIPPEPNPDGGKNPYAATPNLAFPLIATDIIDTMYQKVWVENEVLGEDGYGVPDDGEWVVGYDSTGDGLIDNILGNGVPVPIAITESITDQYDENEYPGTLGLWHQTYVVVDGMTQDLLTQTWVDLDGDGLELTEWSSIDGPDGSPDLTTPVDLHDWLVSMAPWFDQPVEMDETLTMTVTTFDGLLTATIPAAENPNNIWNITYIDGTSKGGENVFQADWYWTGAPGDFIVPDGKYFIDFIDWGNPLENTVAPIVGKRFPVEIALYEKVASTVTLDAWGETMTGFKMDCIENPSSRSEVFGVSELDTTGFTKEICFATVLTNKFFVEVWDPAGGIYKIAIGPGIGPSGKMNFASAGGGWIPTMAGWHRIWLHLNDPLITLEGSIVNNDEHYIMTSGYMAEPLSQNKLDLVGVIGDSTFIDVYVFPPSGRRVK